MFQRMLPASQIFSIGQIYNLKHNTIFMWNHLKRNALEVKIMYHLEYPNLVFSIHAGQLPTNSKGSNFLSEPPQAPVLTGTNVHACTCTHTRTHARTNVHPPHNLKSIIQLLKRGYRSNIFSLGWWSLNLFKDEFTILVIVLIQAHLNPMSTGIP